MCRVSDDILDTCIRDVSEELLVINDDIVSYVYQTEFDKVPKNTGMHISIPSTPHSIRTINSDVSSVLAQQDKSTDLMPELDSKPGHSTPNSSHRMSRLHQRQLGNMIVMEHEHNVDEEEDVHVYEESLADTHYSNDSNNDST